MQERTKMKLIIKTYLLCKGEATANELAEFLNNNFRFRRYISHRTISTMLTHTHYKGHILYGLKKRHTDTYNNKWYYYFEEGMDKILNGEGE